MGFKKNSTPLYVAEFPLVTEKWQDDLLDKWFSHINYLKNILIGMNKNVIKNSKNKLDEINELNKEIYALKKKKYLSIEEKKRKSYCETKRCEIQNSITTDDVEGLVEYPKSTPLFSEFGQVGVADKLLKLPVGGKDVNGHSLDFTSIFPPVTTKITHIIGKDIYASLEDYFYGKGKDLHFKNKKDNNAIKFFYNENIDKFCKVDKINNTITFSKSYGLNKGKKMVMPFKRNKKHVYEDKVLGSTIKQVAIAKKLIRGKEKYYLQLSVEGIPYNKGVERGEGTIGVDPGTSKVTCYGKTIIQYKSPEDVVKLEYKIAELSRSLDRKRRMANPNKYNEDGTIKKGNYDKWIETKNYIKDRNKLHELQRKSATKKKIVQLEYINRLISEGNKLVIEDNDISGWAKRKKETEVKENGKCTSKKRYGKSVIFSAPSQFLTLLKNKFKMVYGNDNVYMVDQKNAKATGTDFTKIKSDINFNEHNTDKNLYYTHVKVGVSKIKLSDGHVHHRDALAAFNLKNWDPVKKEYKIKEMREDYINFCKEENKAIETGEISF